MCFMHDCNTFQNHWNTDRCPIMWLMTHILHSIAAARRNNYSIVVAGHLRCDLYFSTTFLIRHSSGCKFHFFFIPFIAFISIIYPWNFSFLSYVVEWWFFSLFSSRGNFSFYLLSSVPTSTSIYLIFPNKNIQNTSLLIMVNTLSNVVIFVVSKRSELFHMSE